MRSLIWFREDLPVHDNTALSSATKISDEGVCVVFIISPHEWVNHDMAPCRVTFLLGNLEKLSQALNKLNIPLVILHADSTQAIPTLLLKLAQDIKANALHYNIQYEIDELRRDLAVEKLFRKAGVKIQGHHDQTVLAPGEVLTAKESYYTVYTPFRKAWYETLKKRGDISLLPAPKKQKLLSIQSSPN